MEKEKKYCLYLHTTKKDGRIFYVGIGSKRRATTKSSRNKYWHNIVNAYGFDCNILKDNMTWQEACDIEKKMIAFYGRKDLGLGVLCNMADGGEGNINPNLTENQKQNKKQHILKIGLKTRFNKGSEVGKEFRFVKGQEPKNKGTGKKNICKTCKVEYQIRKGGDIYCSKKCQSNCDEFKQKVSISTKGLRKGIENPKLWKAVLQYDKKNNLIMEYKSITEAVNITGIKHLVKVCNGKRKTAGGFIWKYKNEINII